MVSVRVVFFFLMSFSCHGSQCICTCTFEDSASVICRHTGLPGSDARKARMGYLGPRDHTRVTARAAAQGAAPAHRAPQGSPPSRAGGRRRARRRGARRARARTDRLARKGRAHRARPRRVRPARPARAAPRRAPRTAASRNSPASGRRSTRR